MGDGVQNPREAGLIGEHGRPHAQTTQLLDQSADIEFFGDVILNTFFLGNGQVGTQMHTRFQLDVISRGNDQIVGQGAEIEHQRRPQRSRRAQPHVLQGLADLMGQDGLDHGPHFMHQLLDFVQALLLLCTGGPGIMFVGIGINAIDGCFQPAGLIGQGHVIFHQCHLLVLGEARTGPGDEIIRLACNRPGLIPKQVKLPRLHLTSNLLLDGRGGGEFVPCPRAGQPA